MINFAFPFFLLSFLILFSCKKDKNSNCNCISISNAADRYIYPIKPGSVEWNAAGTAGGIDSIYKLCQVPQNVLQSMSTMGVIQTLETNPTLFNMLLRDNKFFGRNEVLSRLNLAWELNKRSDAGEKISDYYNQKNPCCVEKMTTDLEKGDFANNWYYFDMICTQDSLLEKLNLPAKKEFVKIVISKYNIQLLYPNTFGSSKTSSVLILSNILKAANYQPYLSVLSINSNLNSFANTGIITSNTNFNDIISHATTFSNN